MLRQMQMRLSKTCALLGTLSLSMYASSALPQDVSDWKSTTDAANKEASVVVYASLFPDVVEEVSKAFKRAYPNITLQISRAPDGAVGLKVRQERSMSANGADIFIVTTYDVFDEEIEAGRLVGPKGPNAKNFVEQGMYRDLAPILSSMPIGITYNTELVKMAPTSYVDLFRPEYRGLLGIQSADTGANVVAWYDYLRQRYPGYWEKLRDQQPKYYQSSVPLVQAVSSGEIAAGNLGLSALANSLISKGAPVRFFVDETESFGLQFVAGVLKNAPHPNAAQVFTDFLLSREGQIALNGRSFGLSVLPDIPGALKSIKIKTTDTKVYTPEKISTILQEWKTFFKQ
jgi:iron(III) transport system substrate-binding protein